MCSRWLDMKGEVVLASYMEGMRLYSHLEKLYKCHIKNKFFALKMIQEPHGFSTVLKVFLLAQSQIVTS